MDQDKRRRRCQKTKAHFSEDEGQHAAEDRRTKCQRLPFRRLRKGGTKYPDLPFRRLRKRNVQVIISEDEEEDAAVQEDPIRLRKRKAQVVLGEAEEEYAAVQEDPNRLRKGKAQVVLDEDEEQDAAVQEGPKSSRSRHASFHQAVNQDRPAPSPGTNTTQHQSAAKRYGHNHRQIDWPMIEDLLQVFKQENQKSAEFLDKVCLSLLPQRKDVKDMLKGAVQTGNNEDNKNNPSPSGTCVSELEGRYTLKEAQSLIDVVFHKLHQELIEIGLDWKSELLDLWSEFSDWELKL